MGGGRFMSGAGVVGRSPHCCIPACTWYVTSPRRGASREAWGAEPMLCGLALASPHPCTQESSAVMPEPWGQAQRCVQSPRQLGGPGAGPAKAAQSLAQPRGRGRDCSAPRQPRPRGRLASVRRPCSALGRRCAPGLRAEGHQQGNWLRAQPHSTGRLPC